MNDYDKAGRYLIKRDNIGFFRWFFTNPLLSFRAWMDARRVALPNQKDLTNDLVAALAIGETLEAICLELESEARADALTRLLLYLARFWNEPDVAGSLSISCVSGAIFDLTGHRPPCELKLTSEIVPGSRLQLRVFRRRLADDDASQLVATVAAGEVSPWQLGWVPLMQSGRQQHIIQQWREQATRWLPDERDRADLGSLTLTLATLADCRSAWQIGLKGWNMQTSPFLNEIRAESRQEGRQEGVRATLLRLGRQRFGKSPSKKQKSELESITELTRLDALTERLLLVDSWAELLNGRVGQ